jgi:hypothetical protein
MTLGIARKEREHKDDDDDTDSIQPNRRPIFYVWNGVEKGSD